jgi:F-type H+-transporting ATPase subunit delta
MARSPAARRYARALFDLAREQGRADAVAADLSGLARLSENREDYEALIGLHLLSQEKRRDIWRRMLEGRGDPLTLRFILFLVHKKRADLLGLIIHEYHALHLDAQGIVAVQIVSSRPLPEEQKNTIVARMEARLGKKIEATLTTDPSLLGGFQVRAGDVVYDYSVNHQLELLHRKLVSA